MIDILRSKITPFINPAAIVDNASFTTVEIDTAGWDFLTLLFHVGATDIAMAALTITESDTTGSGHAAITGGTHSGTTGDGRLPTATDDNGIFAVHIDLKARKRFIDATVTAGDGAAGTFLSAIAILERGKQEKIDSTSRGLKSQLVLR